MELNTSIQNQFLTFHINKEMYGINISNTREVVENTDLTKVPKMPAYLCGVINLRGSVVPVVDLAIKLEMENTNESKRNNIIVTEITDVNGETIVLGIYADTVNKVLTIESENIEPVPKIGTPINTEFIFGMGKINNEYTILLNIYKVFDSGELEGIIESEKEDIE